MTKAASEILMIHLLKGLIGIALCVLMIAPSSILAQPTQREIAVRFGMTPEQATILFARVKGLDQRIRSLAQSNGVKKATLKAIALELGARSSNLTTSEFIALITKRARDARSAEKRLSELETQLAALDPDGKLSRAQYVLSIARNAFEEGRLENAEAAFGELSLLRASELAGARSVWTEAMDLQALSANLRGAIEHATEIRLAKIAALREQRDAMQREEWVTALTIAEDWLKKGYYSGWDYSALERSVGYFRNLALPLVSQEDQPLEWAQTQARLAMALRRQSIAALRVGTDKRAFTFMKENTAVLRNGGYERQFTLMKESADAYHASLLVYTVEDYPRKRADTYELIGELYDNVYGSGLSPKVYGSDNLKPEILHDAIESFRTALLVYENSDLFGSKNTLRIRLGHVLQELGKREGKLGPLQEAASIFNTILSTKPNPKASGWSTWKAAQSGLLRSNADSMEIEGVEKGRMRQILLDYYNMSYEYYGNEEKTYEDIIELREKILMIEDLELNEATKLFCEGLLEVQFIQDFAKSKWDFGMAVVLSKNSRLRAKFCRV